MSPIALLSLVALCASSALAKTADVIPKAEHTLKLAAKVPRPAGKAAALRTLSRAKRFTAPVAGSEGDEEYLVNVTIGGQDFSLIMDTGSSDTWVAEKGFKCYTLADKPRKEKHCAFGSSGYNASSSSTYSPYPGHNFNITYDDNEFVTGTVGFETITIGGLTIKKQEFGLVNAAAWEGDGVNTGLIGLAYPGLTSVFNTTNSDNDGVSNYEPYNSFFFTAIEEGAVLYPYFSIALNRGSYVAEANSIYDSSLGYLALGGKVPESLVPVTARSVTVPVQLTRNQFGMTSYGYYLVDVNAYNFPESSELYTGGQAFLDTGTTVIYAPTRVAREYNKAFDPPARYNHYEGTYYVSCTATAPPFSVTIGGVKFRITSGDAILPIGDGRCMSGIQDGGSPEDGNIFILGDTFLHNVVATFNVKSNEVTLAARTSFTRPW